MWARVGAKNRWLFLTLATWPTRDANGTTGSLESRVLMESQQFATAV
jgi:hypothetical protein